MYSPMVQRLNEGMHGTFRRALYSEDEVYRYLLEVVWKRNTPRLAIIGLNPSTATELTDDPTLRSCRRIASHLGYGGLIMMNLFAFRATDPKALSGVEDPVGRCNTGMFMWREGSSAEKTVAAWGNHGTYLNRNAEIWPKMKLYCFGRTKAGQPKHPLYLPTTTRLQPFNFVAR